MIICGDALTELRKLESNSIDCVVTSPPYNKPKIGETANSTWRRRNISYHTFDDNLPEPDYQQWQVNVLDELFRVIKPTGSIFYNHKVRRANNVAFHPWEFISRSKCRFYQQITWDRNATPNRSKHFLLPTTELIFWLTKEKPRVYKNQAEQKTEVWRLDLDRKNKHPAPFPEELVENCILLTTEPDDFVLDPFNGSGTTTLLAKRLGRKCIGIELSENYCEVARRRIGE